MGRIWRGSGNRTVIWVNLEQKWQDGDKYHWFNKNDNNNRGGQLSK